MEDSSKTWNFPRNSGGFHRGSQASSLKEGQESNSVNASGSKAINRWRIHVEIGASCNRIDAVSWQRLQGFAESPFGPIPRTDLDRTRETKLLRLCSTLVSNSRLRGGGGVIISRIAFYQKKQKLQFTLNIFTRSRNKREKRKKKEIQTDNFS